MSLFNLSASPPTTSQEAQNREWAERYLRSSHRGSTDWSWPISALLGLAAVVALIFFWRRRSRARFVPTTSEEHVAAPTLFIRGEDFHPERASDGTAIWSVRPRKGHTNVLASQLQLAQALLPQVDDALRDASVRLVRTHAEWFRGRISAPKLARELEVTALRIPPDVKDAVLYARHPTFSGHIVEISVSPSGRLLGADLLG